MDANEYQRLSARTLNAALPVLNENQTQLLMVALGLAGETGELVDALKKMIFHGHSIDKDKVAEEASDLLWYLAALCTTLSLDLSDVMQANVDKLRRRFPDGFSTEASIARVDVNGGDS